MSECGEEGPGTFFICQIVQTRTSDQLGVETLNVPNRIVEGAIQVDQIHFLARGSDGLRKKIKRFQAAAARNAVHFKQRPQGGKAD